MVVNNPLIRLISWGRWFWGVPLDSHDIWTKDPKSFKRRPDKALVQIFSRGVGCLIRRVETLATHFWALNCAIDCSLVHEQKPHFDCLSKLFSIDYYNFYIVNRHWFTQMISKSPCCIQTQSLLQVQATIGPPQRRSLNSQQYIHPSKGTRHSLWLPSIIPPSIPWDLNFCWLISPTWKSTSLPRQTIEEEDWDGEKLQIRYLEAPYFTVGEFAMNVLPKGTILWHHPWNK